MFEKRDTGSSSIKHVLLGMHYTSASSSEIDHPRRVEVAHPFHSFHPFVRVGASTAVRDKGRHGSEHRHHLQSEPALAAGRGRREAAMPLPVTTSFLLRLARDARSDTSIMRPTRVDCTKEQTRPFSTSYIHISRPFASTC